MRTYVRRPMEERLAQGSRVEPSGCRIWTGHLNTAGYGRLAVGRGTATAHRLAWEVANGPIPAGLSVLHRCDVRACINPAHLFLGTPGDNMRDRDVKGRQARGERQGRAVLTAEIVRAIRASSEPTRRIARELGVDAATVRDARTGATWRHVE